MEATSIRGSANYGGQQKAMLMRNEGASESFVAMLGSQASLQGQALLLVLLLFHATASSLIPSLCAQQSVIARSPSGLLC